jgi:Glycine rich protein/RTX calcium-binding nonapeptide repeat (4 copies)
MVLCALLAVALPFSQAAPAPPGTHTLTFSYTGGAQAWVVPDNVSLATFDLHGAEGGAAGEDAARPGGRGARVRAQLAVTPGERLEIRVGGMGGSAGSEVGGFNGGGGQDVQGDDFAVSGGGGGASDVRRGPGFGLSDRLLVAAGGGGAGGDGLGGAGAPGGAGGPSGAAGSTGADGDPPGEGGSGGQPGSVSAGTDADGARGGDGSLGQGGAMQHDEEATFFGGGDGGGGGGGLYGGGAGGQGGAMFEALARSSGGGGGGGGSSFVTPAAAGATVEQGVRSGHGVVVVTFSVGDNPGRAPVAETGAATRIASQWQLEGTVDPGTTSIGRRTTYHFEYGGTTGYGFQTPSRPVLLQPPPVTVRGIAQNVRRGAAYHYRLIATNEFGQSVGADRTFTVPPAGRCAGREATIASASGAGLTRGTDGTDVIVGTRGPDRIDSGGGRDFVCTRGGNDRVTGGAGADSMYTGAGRDTVAAGAGRDTIDTGAGTDTVAAGTGRDRVVTGAGRDVLRLASGGRDRAACGAGVDRARADSVDRLRGCERVRRVGR